MGWWIATIIAAYCVGKFDLEVKLYKWIVGLFKKS